MLVGLREVGEGFFPRLADLSARNNSRKAKEPTERFFPLLSAPRGAPSPTSCPAADSFRYFLHLDRPLPRLPARPRGAHPAAPPLTCDDPARAYTWSYGDSEPGVRRASRSDG